VKRIYMDNNATTAVRPEVLEAMLPFFKEQFGNPSSIHWAGRAVSDSVEKAREQVAKLVNCFAAEIVFTSCGTEGDNFAIKGTADALREKGDHIITTAVEHHAVLGPCKFLENHGFRVTYLPVDQYGMLDLKALEEAITGKTVLISTMWGNNETGTIFPIEEIGGIAGKYKVCFHTDAVQAVGKVPIDVQSAGVDLLTLSGHKIGAPKGVGALYVRKGSQITPLLHGGHQERSLRGGTYNVAGIVGLGVACELAGQQLEVTASRVRVLRDRLEQGIMKHIPDVKLNGHPQKRFPNTLNVSFAYIEGESILLNLDMEGVAASSGSACSSGSEEPSHVMVAMGVDIKLAHSSIRFSLGPDNTEEDIDYLLEILPPIVQRLREMSPLYQRRGESMISGGCRVIKIV
jgi:cysteine desulfurase